MKQNIQYCFSSRFTGIWVESELTEAMMKNTGIFQQWKNTSQTCGVKRNKYHTWRVYNMPCQKNNIEIEVLLNIKVQGGMSKENILIAPYHN